MRKVWALLRAMRPLQWLKNGACLAGIVFAGHALDLRAELYAWVGFFVFCAASSAAYLVNDVRDREADRAHPRKRLRPIASGGLSPSIALLAAVALLAAAGAGAVWLGPVFAIMLGCYVALGLVYTLLLKRIVLVDVLCIAVFFILRVWAGIAAVTEELPTPWILLCTFFLALFLALAKRRGEGGALERRDESGGARRALSGYRVGFLDHLLTVSATGALFSYALYVIFAHPHLRLHLLLTILPVVYGIGRYFYLVTAEEKGEEPERLLVTDVPLLVSVAVWVVACALILYLVPAPS